MSEEGARGSRKDSDIPSVLRYSLCLGEYGISINMRALGIERCGGQVTHSGIQNNGPLIHQAARRSSALKWVSRARMKGHQGWIILYE